MSRHIKRHRQHHAFSERVRKILETEKVGSIAAQRRFVSDQGQSAQRDAALGNQAGKLLKRRRMNDDFARLNWALEPKFMADDLRRLHGANEGAGDNEIDRAVPRAYFAKQDA